MCLCKIHPLLCTQRGDKDARETRAGKRGEESGEDGGRESGVVIAHIGQEIKVTCFRIN